ncbi:MAG: hypothetical protein ACXV8J_11855 [Methylobacter sp.]
MTKKLVANHIFDHADALYFSVVLSLFKPILYNRPMRLKSLLYGHHPKVYRPGADLETLALYPAIMFKPLGASNKGHFARRLDVYLEYPIF